MGAKPAQYKTLYQTHERWERMDTEDLSPILLLMI
jgi:hypothetical protein